VAESEPTREDPCAPLDTSLGAAVRVAMLQIPRALGECVRDACAEAARCAYEQTMQRPTRSGAVEDKAKAAFYRAQHEVVAAMNSMLQFIAPRRREAITGASSAMWRSRS
jgi:hypothetical protein